MEKEITKEGKLVCKVMTVGAPEYVMEPVQKFLRTLHRFFGSLVEGQMKGIANNAVTSEVFEKCGYSIAVEQPERLANLLKRFLL